MVLLFCLALSVYFKYFGEELEYPSGIQITRERERRLNMGFSVSFSGISAAKAGLWCKQHCLGYYRISYWLLWTCCLISDVVFYLWINWLVSKFPSTFKSFLFFSNTVNLKYKFPILILSRNFIYWRTQYYLLINIGLFSF